MRFGPVNGGALWAECCEMLEYRLEKGEFGRMFRQSGDCAFDYIRDGFAVRVDDVTLLVGKLPAA